MSNATPVICEKILGWYRREFCCGWHWFKDGNQVAPRSFNPFTNLRDTMVVLTSLQEFEMTKSEDRYTVKVGDIEYTSQSIQESTTTVARLLIGKMK